MLKKFLYSEKLSFYLILLDCLFQAESMGTEITHNFASTTPPTMPTEELSIKIAPGACCKPGLRKGLDKTKSWNHAKDWYGEQ